ncbi:MAG TPA: hypothetical protein PLC54_07870, partial [Spirochaetales bacterium]|nr:hypothetical protein [Spirochaetales bacterium]
MGNAAHSTYNSTALGIERAAVELWPLLTGSDNSRQRSEYAAALADILGAPKEFHRYITGSPGELAERQT